MSWLPSPGINCLVGPGDTGKSTFPARSGIAPAHLDLEDARRDYPAIKAAIARFLAGRHIDDVLFASYSRVIVDEYQDCDPDQHVVVCHLATILPTVVLGDPMQEIFNWQGHHPDGIMT